MKPSRRQDRGKVARGGAAKRKFPSRAATLLAERGLVTPSMKVLDYGCGHGMDADTFHWDGYDPATRDVPVEAEAYDVVTCINVLSAVSDAHRALVLHGIGAALKPEGKAYVAVPRNLPKGGKVSGYARRPQTNVYLKHGEVVWEEAGKLVIYALTREHVLAEAARFQKDTIGGRTGPR